MYNNVHYFNRGIEMAAKKGYCDVCGNEYSNIHQHRRTKKHLENMEKATHEQTTGEGAEVSDTQDSNSRNSTENNERSTTDSNEQHDKDAGGAETGGAEKAKLPEKKTLPEVKEDKSSTIRIVDEAQENSGKGLMDSINEMLTPEVKTALGGLIAGAVALAMSKLENIGKPAEEAKNIVHDLHGGAHEW